MNGRVLAQAGRLDDDVDPQIPPGQLGRVALGGCERRLAGVAAGERRRDDRHVRTVAIAFDGGGVRLFRSGSHVLVRALKVAGVTEIWVASRTEARAQEFAICRTRPIRCWRGA